MTDIFREVEEEVRRERYQQLWKKYGDYVIAGAALLVICAAAFQLWRVYEQRQKAGASEAYVAAQQLLDQGRSSEAAAAFSKIEETAPAGYAQLALLQKANALYASGDVPEAVDIYKQIAAKDDVLLAPMARLRAAWATVETAPRADIKALIEPLADESSPWHPMAREILAYADYHAGNAAKALKEYQNVAKDSNSPAEVRRRASVMATFIAAGGDNNFGTVPPPPPAANTPSPSAPAQGAKPQ